MMILYKLLLSSLVALQVIGPSWVLAIQTSQSFAQEASSEALIAGLRGVVTVTPGTKNSPGYAPKYRSALSIGDVISTEEESVAEILLENQGLVTIQEYSEVMLDKKADGGLSVALEVGAAEWSIPTQREGGISLTFTTPNIRATTHGGLVTAEVQQTLGAMAWAPRLHDSFLIRTSLHAQGGSAGNGGLLETFCVNEGDLTVEYPGAQQGVWQQETVSPGECRGFLNGQPRAMGTQEHLADWRAVCAVGTHCEIPESAKKLIAKKQMGQALALERALVGSETEDPKVDEQVVLATTGQSLGASIEGLGPGDPGVGGVILPTTGVGPGGGSGPGPGGPPPPTPQIPDVNVGGAVPPLTPFFNVASNGGAGGTPPPPLPGNIQTGGSIWPVNGMPGGQGLLTFISGDFTADKELLLADSGLLASAPHLGKAPLNSLVISNLSPDGAGRPSNQDLPLDFPSFHQPPTDWAGVAHRNHLSNVQLGTETSMATGTGSRKIPSAQAEQLAEFARSYLIDPENIFASLPESGADFPCEFSSGSCFEVILAAGLGALEKPDPKVDSDSGIDGTIQVRSASTMDPRIHGNRVVTLKKGVVLGNTQVSLAPQEKTQKSFSGLETTLGFAPQASAVSILGELGDPALGEPGDPAIVHVEDRVLAILGNSRIQPANSLVTTSLIAILDGRLHGPVDPSVIGKDAAGGDIVRADVSPIIEMIGSSAEVATAVMIGSTAKPNQTGDLDQALLEASSPLLAMIGSSLTTASDFGRVAGQNAKLDATLIPGDALVRLNASSLMVNGNLFSVTGGGQLIVNGGSLLSLQGNSTVTLAGGAFVAVGPNSSFTLTGGSLVDFGFGTNTVTITGTSGSCLGCNLSTTIPNLSGVPVLLHPSATIAVGNGFVSYAGVGQGTMGGVGFANTVNVSPGAAVLQVDQGGTLVLNP